MPSTPRGIDGIGGAGKDDALCAAACAAARRHAARLQAEAGAQASGTLDRMYDALVAPQIAKAKKDLGDFDEKAERDKILEKKAVRAVGFDLEAERRKLQAAKAAEDEEEAECCRRW